MKNFIIQVIAVAFIAGQANAVKIGAIQHHHHGQLAQVEEHHHHGQLAQVEEHHHHGSLAQNEDTVGPDGIYQHQEPQKPTQATTGHHHHHLGQISNEVEPAVLAQFILGVNKNTKRRHRT